jgi:hypothetical protein
VTVLAEPDPRRVVDDFAADIDEVGAFHILRTDE